MVRTGCTCQRRPVLEGKHIFKANDEIIAELDARSVLLAHLPYDHSYPHCWRHKTPIIFRATPQWFVSMSKAGLLAQAKEAVEGVNWVPDWGRARIDAMLADRPDWCISRQRTWGVPIPLFVHRQSGELHPRTLALIEAIAVHIESSGIDAWFDLEPSTLLGDEAEDYEKVKDTLDVWFDSGVTQCLRIAQARGSECPGGFVSRRIRPASWVVSVLVADRDWRLRRSPLSIGAYPRFHGGWGKAARCPSRSVILFRPRKP